MRRGRRVTGKLRRLLASMRPWEKRPLVRAGRAVVELVKIPRRERRRKTVPERLALHVRLDDAFKGVFIDDSLTLEDLIVALSHERVREIARALDSLNRRRTVEYKLW